MSEQRDDLKAWLTHAQQLLTEGAQALDAETIESLRRVREKALGFKPSKAAKPVTPAPPATPRDLPVAPVAAPPPVVPSPKVVIPQPRNPEPTRSAEPAPSSEPARVVARVARVSEPISEPRSSRTPEPVRAPEPPRMPEPTRASEPARTPAPVRASKPQPVPSRAGAGRRVSLGWLALAFALVITIGGGLFTMRADVTRSLEDVPLLSDDEELTYYQHLDFLRWLAATEEKAQ